MIFTQSLTDSDPGGDETLSGHARHVNASTAPTMSENLPAGQASHGVAAFPSPSKRPGAQATQP